MPTPTERLQSIPQALSAPAEQPPGAKPFDYGINLQSDVFGAQLFTGSFSRSGAALFNPQYVVAVGDVVQVRLWGAFDLDSTQTVDAQGNIFLPNVGPVQVAGTKNAELTNKVRAGLSRVYARNFEVYTKLRA